jgi:hypothetical protein
MDFPENVSLGPLSDGCTYCGRPAEGWVVGDRSETMTAPDGRDVEVWDTEPSCASCAHRRGLIYASKEEVDEQIDYDDGRLSLDEAWAAAERGDFIPAAPEVDLIAAAALGARLRQELLGLTSDGPLESMPFEDLPRRMRDHQMLAAGIAMAKAGYELRTGEGYAFVSALLHTEWRMT